MASESEIIEKIKKFKEQGSPEFKKYMDFYKEKFPEFYKSKLMILDDKIESSAVKAINPDNKELEKEFFKGGKILGETPIFNINNGKKEKNGESIKMSYDESIFKGGEEETVTTKRKSNKKIIIAIIAVLIVAIGGVAAYLLLI
ncbi:MAG: hypothetical protein PHT91_01970 [Candidatus Nanoarchaeia archaeon]|nr:hypothetical protein [Candidatus Nanoarchaeia archaeon]MDD5054474.1 hypothetical protein [Candidatus Nanoarchaeia archaeon]MDD5499620.1 hypothetical protein [Candidatus Nanoarchaeia archaeon]